MKSVTSHFVEIEFLLEKIENTDCEIFVFGTDASALRLIHLLKSHNIKIENYVESDSEKIGQKYDEIEIISPKEILKSSNPLVIVASYPRVDICNKLLELNIDEFYIIANAIQLEGNNFINIKDLLNKIEGNEYEIFVFGTSNFAKLVSEELESFNINIVGYLDNNKSKWGSLFKDKEIFQPSKLLEVKNPLVIAGTSYENEILGQLKLMGIEDVYFLCDIFKYPYESMLKQNKILEKYNNENKTGKVLIKAFDGLGDNILKLGIYKFLASMKDGYEKFYIIVHKRSNYELLSLFFKNVTLIDEKKYLEDDEYRLEVLTRINKEEYDYDLYFLQLSYYELINWNNTNIPINYRNEIVTNRDYFLNSQIDLVKRVYDVPNGYNFSPKGLINNKIANTDTERVIDGKYVCFGMGHDSECKYYAPKNWAFIVEYLINLKYKIVFLGYGAKDEEIYSNVLENIQPEYREKIINLCSKLSVIESLNIINDSELYVGLDSGLGHCAYVLDKKAVILIGGDQYKKYINNDEKIAYVLNNLYCYYCKDCMYKKDTDDYGKCVRGISVESVIKAVENRLT